VKFWASTAFSPPSHYLALAPALENAGFHGMVLADHLIAPKVRVTPYPYSADGRPGWNPDTAFPDVWVAVGALAAATTTLEFASAVYVAPARDLFTVAKAVGTAAVLSGDRVTFGVGAGWMAEEFELTGQSFADRGRRLDEMLAVLRELWSRDWVEHRGRHYDFPAVQVSPRPSRPIPVWTGGYSRAAIRRATALSDGWVGVASSEEAGERIIEALTAGLRANGREGAPFDITLSLPIPVTSDDVSRWAQRGVTGLIVRPWASALVGELADLASAQAADLDRKIAAARRFGVEVIAASCAPETALS
jgi:probable F420-dependent oxidoreductase